MRHAQEHNEVQREENSPLQKISQPALPHSDSPASQDNGSRGRNSEGKTVKPI
jgi:hypothetical protein